MKEVVEMVVCPKCKSPAHVVQVGKRKNMSGVKQKYRCNSCWTWFVEDDGFKGMRHKPEIISEGCSCYARGMTLAKVTEHLSDLRDTDVCPATIWSWVRKYSKSLKKMGRKANANNRRANSYG